MTIKELFATHNKNEILYGTQVANEKSEKDIESLIAQSNSQLLDTLEKEIKGLACNCDGTCPYDQTIEDVLVVINNLKKGLK